MNTLEAYVPAVIRDNSLRLAGVLNTFGDITLLIDRAKQGSGLGIAGGVLYTAGGLNLALFGNSGKHRAITALQEDIAAYIYEQTGICADSLTVDKPHDAVQWLRDNAANTTMTAYTAGAGLLLGEGYQAYKKSDFHPDMRHKLYYGISSLGLKAASLLIPEEGATHTQQAGGNVCSKAVNFIKEKPLRLFGYGSIVTELMLANEAIHKFHKGDKAGFAFNMATAASYIAADLLTAISHKDESHASYQLNDNDMQAVSALAEQAMTEVPEVQRADIRSEINAMIARAGKMQDDDSIAQSETPTLYDIIPDKNIKVERIEETQLQLA